MRTRLALACSYRPFSNGTEGSAWISAWCEHCVHDHDITHDGATGDEGCDILLCSMMPDFPGDDFPWPEAWLPEPDDGDFFLPSRMICASFAPCEKGGCKGDPGANDRAERVAEVTAYWAQHGAEVKP